MEQRITESASKYRHLEQMSVTELLTNINKEDQTVALAVEQCIPDIAPLVTIIAKKMKDGARLFYIGAGTSGRLGVVDASEIPPTYGIPHERVVGIIAGGDIAIRKSVENAEDSPTQAWEVLKSHGIDYNDVVIGIAASGTTPYVINGLKKCQEENITTGCITCNPNAPLTKVADFPIVVVVGPEFVTGSSRMKAGTAQKLILNMISTSVMIQLGRVKDNKMVDMQLSNVKLVDRGVRMVMQLTDLDYKAAEILLQKHKNVRAAVDFFNGGR
jgi:N-acetylmuramic acid 6-phosphate etherase